MRRLRPPTWAALATVLAACVPHADAPLAALELARNRVQGGSKDAQQLALSGYHALLVQGDAEQARARFDAALAQDPANPYALQGQALLATRTGALLRTLTASLDLCERAPKHPLASVAARTALDLAGQAQGLDEVLRSRVPGILERGLPGDAGQLLRTALLNAEMSARDVPSQQRLVKALGMPTVATLVGPLSPWHHLDLTQPTAPEKSGDFSTLPAGPFGPLSARELRFDDGRFALSGEPPTGDVYLYAVDLQAPERATYVLRTITSMSHVATLDGATVFSRLTWEHPAPTLTERAFTLDAGPHRLIIRFARERQAGNLSVALHRLDGRPSALTFSAVKGTPARWKPDASLRTDVDDLFPTAASLAQALEPQAGPELANFLAAKDALSRDHDGAQRLAAALPAELGGAFVSWLKAELALGDHSVGARVGKGRAARELEAVLTKDPGFVLAQVMAAQQALDDGRQLEALEQLRKARGAGASAPVLALQARVQLALGLDAAAAATAEEATAALPGLCEAAVLQYDVARRRDAVAQSAALLERTAHCSGYEVRAAEHARTRGQLEVAAGHYQALLARDESQAQAALSLAGLQSAQKRFDDALALLTRTRALWPRNAAIVKAMADVQEQAGRLNEAQALRAAALELDGGDLALARLVERTRTGKELLEDEAISTDEALKSWEAAPGSSDATSTFVLDAAAIRVGRDGSMVDRIHIIQKALDQQGVQDVAEVQIPEGAVVLKLRTLKPDGRSLEPEDIEGKEGISLPGVQVGDFVEYEYLQAHPPRGPGQPGFTASNFYFQIARQPNSRSTYVVKAPKGAGLKVDAHNVKAPSPAVEGEWEVFRHEERRVPPYIPEPLGPPSGNEWLPFVSVGAGQEGNEGVLRGYGDSFLDRGAVTFEVERFAREAAGQATGTAAAKAVYAAVMKKLSGRDMGLSTSAAASLGEERGSRTWLLYASLKALGFDVRLAAVRTFNADPAAYLFPAEGLYNYVCVHVRLPDGQVLWLDPLVRYAPFDELPEFALGGREAWLLPEPGKAAQKLATPPATPKQTKEVTLTMTLAEDGALSGTGVELYTGFEAAQLAEALESISPDQRDQALQSALSRYFGGADLSNLSVEAKREVGGTVKVSYAFVAKRFGRVDGPGHLITQGFTFPHMLGRRYVTTSERSTPLFIESTETARVKATVSLPHGWKLVRPMPDVKLDGPSYHYLRQELQTGDVLTINEDFRLGEARIPVKEYAPFAQFAGEVDLVQQRDLLLEQQH